MLPISHHDIHPIWRKKRRKKVQNVRLIAIIFVFFLTIFTGNNAVTPLGPEAVFDGLDEVTAYVLAHCG
jgi:hypothetical protein